ncbi:La protein-like protein [Erysiphe neolycopersici]|uniref:La protein-like protein n=1 Tax=Erysiphe neolycopersici TaxID=212602 RepID=A0A420HVV2_9PEZI|nr:La protein-like protein [Erysiphe neolycopersici]
MLKTTARIQEGVKNSKYDPSVLPITDDPMKIRAQVEFYFGDTNLSTDKFLFGLTGGSSNVPVPIKKICEFGRMRRFSPYSSIVSALKESQFLKVSGEDGEEVIERRVPFNPDESRETEVSRSIYAKGFGDEEASTQFDIEAFFAPYGPINAVRLRRTFKKLFKGSVFVEFADEEIAQKFLNLPSKPLWKEKYELLIMSKKAYLDLKKDEFASKGKKSNSKENQNQGRGRDKGRDNNRGNRGGKNNHRGKNSHRASETDPDDWKKRREEDRASGFKNNRRQNNGKKGKYDRRGGNDEDHKVDGDINPELPVSVKRPREDDEHEQSTSKKPNIETDVAIKTEPDMPDTEFNVPDTKVNVPENSKTTVLKHEA